MIEQPSFLFEKEDDGDCDSVVDDDHTSLFSDKQNTEKEYVVVGEQNELVQVADGRISSSSNSRTLYIYIYIYI